MKIIREKFNMYLFFIFYLLLLLINFAQYFVLLHALNMHLLIAKNQSEKEIFGSELQVNILVVQCLIFIILLIISEYRGEHILIITLQTLSQKPPGAIAVQKFDVSPKVSQFYLESFVLTATFEVQIACAKILPFLSKIQ